MTINRFYLFSLTLILFLAFSSIAGAAPLIKVTISADQEFFNISDKVLIHIVTVNQSKNPEKILKWLTAHDVVEESLFSISRNGASVKYTGRHYKRPPIMNNDYLILKPGESFTRDFYLDEYYNLSVSGKYSVTYNVKSLNLFSEIDDDKKVLDVLTSNTLSFSIAGRAAAPRRDDIRNVVTVIGGNTFHSCSVKQQSDVIKARTQAGLYAAGTLSFLNININSQPKARYTTWFGAYTQANYNTVLAHFSAISNRMDSSAITFDCGCSDRNYAYVYSDKPYTIYLCGYFWMAPLSGTDSRAGTLIHEMSHFHAVASTEDWVYGRAKAKKLAISNPTKAINNADNHEYIAEKTPVQ